MSSCIPLIFFEGLVWLPGHQRNSAKSPVMTGCWFPHGQGNDAPIWGRENHVPFGERFEDPQLAAICRYIAGKKQPRQFKCQLRKRDNHQILNRFTPTSGVKIHFHWMPMSNSYSCSNHYFGVKLTLLWLQSTNSFATSATVPIWGMLTIQLEWPSAPNREFDRTPSIALKRWGLPQEENSKCWQPQVTNSWKQLPLRIASYQYCVRFKWSTISREMLHFVVNAHVFSVLPQKNRLGLLGFQDHIWAVTMVISGVQIRALSHQVIFGSGAGIRRTPVPTGSLPSHPMVLVFWSAPWRVWQFGWGDDRILGLIRESDQTRFSWKQQGTCLEMV